MSRMPMRVLLAGASLVLFQPAWAPGAVAQEPATEAGRISVTFDAAPIQEVAVTFADFAGRSIVLAADLTGSVTAIVKDEPWEAAFRAILQAQGARMIEVEGGIILVERLESVAGRQDVEELVTRVFPIRYQWAADLESAIIGVLSERGRIAVAGHSNSLVVTDVPAAIGRVAGLLGGAPVS